MRHHKSYIPTLDGWRALSVVGVIFYHGRFGFFRQGSLSMKLASHGNIGVDIFFAISGFLICGLLLHEFASTGELSLKRFYIRRVFRILPPYYAAIIGICLISLFAGFQTNREDVIGCLLFYRNYLPVGLDVGSGFYTAHFWSLAVEEHFYLIWPILLLAVKPKRAGRAALLLAVLVFAWRIVQTHLELWPRVFIPANLMIRTDTRIDALVWGCLAAIYFPAIQRLYERFRFSQLWLPILAVLLVSEALHAPGFILVRTILLPALVLSTVLEPASALGRVLEWKAVRWLGTLSYSVYLWQELFLPEVHSAAASGSFHNLQRWPWNIAAILAFAVASRYCIEIPMTRLGHRLSTSSFHLGGQSVQSKPALS